MRDALWDRIERFLIGLLGAMAMLVGLAAAPGDLCSMISYVESRPPKQGSWKDRILFISSVSGGSLATADFAFGFCRVGPLTAAGELPTLVCPHPRRAWRRAPARAR